jgi:hypothetical protein
VTLSLSDGTYVLTWDVGRGSRSAGGAATIEGDRLALRQEETATTDEVRFRLSGPTLALSADASGWDFDGNGRDEAAAFVAVLVRL